MLGGLDDIPEKLGEYDFIDLSNIFDWMGDDSVNKIADLLDEKMKPNAVLMFRQLNNNRNIQSRFSRISFDDEIGLKLLSQDRSFFYCKINVGRKI
jgi:S-adenosylmethionine:diacylglycerol 3-amino-3-carboxypropyl transferase